MRKINLVIIVLTLNVCSTHLIGGFINWSLLGRKIPAVACQAVQFIQQNKTASCIVAAVSGAALLRYAYCQYKSHARSLANEPSQGPKPSPANEPKPESKPLSANDRLFQAIENEDLDAVNAAIADRANVNAMQTTTTPWSDGIIQKTTTYPLFLAIKHGDPAIINALLVAGADANATECRSCTGPSLIAPRKHYLTPLESLLCTADVHDQQGKKYPLCSLDTLIVYGANVNHTDEFGCTLLHQTVTKAANPRLYTPIQNEYAYKLIIAGARLDIKTAHDQKTPVEMAQEGLSANHPIRVLLEQCAEARKQA